MNNIKLHEHMLQFRFISGDPRRRCLKWIDSHVKTKLKTEKFRTFAYLRQQVRQSTYSPMTSLPLGYPRCKSCHAE